MSTNVKYRARERQRKRESRRQASEVQREKIGDRDLERKIKKGDMFLIEEQHEIFVVAVTKLEMLAATSQISGVNERSEKK